MKRSLIPKREKIRESVWARQSENSVLTHSNLKDLEIETEKLWNNSLIKVGTIKPPHESDQNERENKYFLVGSLVSREHQNCVPYHFHQFAHLISVLTFWMVLNQLAKIGQFCLDFITVFYFRLDEKVASSFFVALILKSNSLIPKTQKLEFFENCANELRMRIDGENCSIKTQCDAFEEMPI